MKKYVVIFVVILLFIFSAKISNALEYTVDLSLALSEEYNDNIFLTHDRVSDFITRVSPGISLTARSVTSEMRLGFAPTFNFYSDNSDLNYTGYSFTGSGLFRLSEKMSLNITETYLQSKDPVDRRGIVDIINLGPQFGLAEYRVNVTSAILSYRLRGNLIYTLGATYSSVDYKEPGFSDVKIYSGNMGLTYIQSDRDTFTASARYSKYDYRPTSDATDQVYTLGVTHRFTPTLTLGVTGGVVITKIEDTGATSTDFSGGVDLTKTFERGMATLYYRQTVTAATGSDAGQPLRAQTAGLRVSRDLAEKWTGSLTAAYTKYKSTEPPDVKIDETAFGAGLTYNFRHWATLTLSYYYLNHNDKILNAADYNNNIVLLTLRLAYSKKL